MKIITIKVNTIESDDRIKGYFERFLIENFQDQDLKLTVEDE